eukprot:COSAG01_NODE_2261_length_8057_cov_38.489570_10_plen_129_part_00
MALSKWWILRLYGCCCCCGRRFIFIGTIVLLNATATAMCFFAAAVSKNAGTANLWASCAWQAPIYLLHVSCAQWLLARGLPTLRSGCNAISLDSVTHLQRGVRRAAPHSTIYNRRWCGVAGLQHSSLR